jgi:hypothetical protein
MTDDALIISPRTTGGARLHLPAPPGYVPDDRSLGFKGRAYDPSTNQYFDIGGAVCPLPGCCCDAVAVPVASADAPRSAEPTHARFPPPAAPR